MLRLILRLEFSHVFPDEKEGIPCPSKFFSSRVSFWPLLGLVSAVFIYIFRRVPPAQVLSMETLLGKRVLLAVDFLSPVIVYGYRLNLSDAVREVSISIRSNKVSNILKPIKISFVNLSLL
jgi:hypothetical protein